MAEKFVYNTQVLVSDYLKFADSRLEFLVPLLEKEYQEYDKFIAKLEEYKALPWWKFWVSQPYFSAWQLRSLKEKVGYWNTEILRAEYLSKTEMKIMIPRESAFFKWIKELA